MIYCQLGMIEPFRVLQNSDFRLLTCASGTFTMFAKFFKRLIQVIFKRLMHVISYWAENQIAVLEEHYSQRLIFGDERFNIGNSTKSRCYRSTVMMLTKRLCLRSSNHLQEYNWSHVALVYHDHSRESGKGHSMCYFSLSSVSFPKIKFQKIEN